MTRSPGEGLAQVMGLPEGTVIAYACPFNQNVPDDGAYARALSTRVREREVALPVLLRQVQADVERETQARPEFMMSVSAQPSFAFSQPRE